MRHPVFVFLDSCFRRNDLKGMVIYEKGTFSKSGFGTSTFDSHFLRTYNYNMKAIFFLYAGFYVNSWQSVADKTMFRERGE